MSKNETALSLRPPGVMHGTPPRRQPSRPWISPQSACLPKSHGRAGMVLIVAAFYQKPELLTGSQRLMQRGIDVVGDASPSPWGPGSNL